MQFEKVSACSCFDPRGTQERTLRWLIGNTVGDYDTALITKEIYLENRGQRKLPNGSLVALCFPPETGYVSCACGTWDAQWQPLYKNYQEIPPRTMNESPTLVD